MRYFTQVCFLLEHSFFKQDHSGAEAIGVMASFWGLCSKAWCHLSRLLPLFSAICVLPILTIYLQMKGELLLIILIGSPNGVKSSFFLFHPHQHQSCLVPGGDTCQSDGCGKVPGDCNQLPPT